MNKPAKIILAVLALLLLIGAAVSVGYIARKNAEPVETTVVTEPQEDPWLQYGDYWYRTNGSYVETRTPATMTVTVHYKDSGMNTIATATYDVTYYTACITVEGTAIPGQKAANREYDLKGYFLNNDKLYDAAGNAVDNVFLPFEAYQMLLADMAKDYTLCTLADIDKTSLVTFTIE